MWCFVYCFFNFFFIFINYYLRYKIIDRRQFVLFSIHHHSKNAEQPQQHFLSHPSPVRHNRKCAMCMTQENVLIKKYIRLKYFVTTTTLVKYCMHSILFILSTHSGVENIHTYTIRKRVVRKEKIGVYSVIENNTAWYIRARGKLKWKTKA